MAVPVPDSPKNPPQARYAVAPEPTFRFRPDGAVSARAFDKVFLIPAEIYKIIAAFFPPATAQEALARLPDVAPADFQDMMDDLVERGLLARIHEPVDDSPPDESAFRGLFRPDVLTPESMADMQRHLADGRALLIKNVFREDLAKQIHDELSGNMRWHLADEYDQPSHFRFRSADVAKYFPPALSQVRAAYASPGAMALMQTLSGRNCQGEPEFSASCYLPGDHTHPHDDNWSHRSIVAIWNVTREWHPHWGGQFFWAPSGTSIAPQFNSMIMFNVTPTSTHQVLIVSPSARNKRLSVNGWWTNRTPPPNPRAHGAPSGIPQNAYGRAPLVLNTSGVIAL